MSRLKADLHLHTTFSDGNATPKEAAEKIRALEHITKEDVLSSTGLGKIYDYLKDKGDAEGIGELDALLNESIETAHNTHTFCKLDHNTLLGTEEFISAVGKLAPKKRIIVGAELTAQVNLTRIGDYSIHVPVFFYDQKGFDMMKMKKYDRDVFFDEINFSYSKLLNRLAKANNYRFGEVLREKCNRYFFGGDEMITSDFLKRTAMDARKSVMSTKDIMNFKVYEPLLLHTDLALALHKSGIDESPEEIAYKYFRREGLLYVPFSENKYSMDLEELLSEMDSISRESPVKVKKGIGHPSTYVRAIAKSICAEEGRGKDEFYSTDAEKTANIVVKRIIRAVANKGLVDFIESDYPRYIRKLSADADGREIEENIQYIKKEEEFASRQQDLWRRAAQELGIATSGGSDTHFSTGTPALAYGLGDVSYDDSEVDRIFKQK